jgi:hypothetical protein
MVMAPSQKVTMESVGLRIGVTIAKDENGFVLEDGSRVELDDDFASQLLFRPA